MCSRAHRWASGTDSPTAAFLNTQCGWRCTTVICPTCGVSSATNWIAVAPVPTTATFLPARSTVSSHSALCMIRPVNFSSPGMFGRLGVFR